jgi:hypothetical protein
MSFICLNAGSICLENTKVTTNTNVTVYWPSNQIPIVSSQDMTLFLYQGNMNTMQLVDPCNVQLDPISQFPLYQIRSDSRLGWQTIMIQETEGIKRAMIDRNEFFLQLVVSYPRVCMLGPWVTNVFSLVLGPVPTILPTLLPTEVPISPRSSSVSTEWIIIIALACLVTLTIATFALYKLRRKKQVPLHSGFGFSEHFESQGEIPKMVEVPSSNPSDQEDPEVTIRPSEQKLPHRWSVYSFSHLSHLDRDQLSRTPSLSHIDRDRSVASKYETSTVDIPICEDAVYRAVDKESIEQGLETLCRGLKRLDQGLLQLDIGLSKLNEISSAENSFMIAEAFREQLINPPEGWEKKSVESISKTP